MLIAIVLLAASELRIGRGTAWKVVTGAARRTSILGPTVLACATLLPGALLLWSGATPVLHARIGPLERVIPLPLVEVSHFFGSIVGACLVLLAHELQRRLDSALWLAIGLIGTGIVASLLKGFDWKEALVLIVLLAALLGCRREFYRSGLLFHQRFTSGWVAAVLLAIGCSL